MTPADLLQLRRDVARVLGLDADVPWEPSDTGCPGIEWLPPLEADHVCGVLLGELVRRGVPLTLHARKGLRPCVVMGPHDEDYIYADDIGTALAAALVAVAGGASS